MRHRWTFLGVAAGPALALLAGMPAPARAADCGALAGLALPQARVEAEEVAAGSYRPPSGPVQEALPAFCRVRGVVEPVAGSRIGFELWLPAGGWNGRLQMFGNGGYSSALSYGEMAGLLRRGYATLGTDTGHEGDDPSFAEGRPEAIVDWGHRAVHESVVRAKQVVAAFYGQPARRTFFAGCSTGGHQGMASAQRYPEDFDGIIAGASGGNRTHLNAGFLWQYQRNHAPGDDAAALVPPAKLRLVAEAALAACRAGNGAGGGHAADGWLNDPLACRFDPAALRCAGGDGADCLTDPQVEALRSMYDGPRNPRTGERIHFPFPRGSENSGGPPSLPGWSLYWADPGNPSAPARVNYWRHWAGFGAGWSWWAFDFDRDIAAVDARLAPVINATDPDLSAFRRRGGKLIAYHGLADPVVPFAESIAYHGRVAEAAGGDVPSFYRLFLVPGMEHCRGGPGANQPELQAALERWVEEGTPPARILAHHREGNRPDGAIQFSRPLCPYPQRAVHDGAGDQATAESYRCAEFPGMDLPEIGASYRR
ncbi:tannase/feruloyl esterase family alpha/beta hydrolase [Roseomonas nepalensis]|uniref:Tannase/feruloyl esterase family alpha/beta hydrolase n=1 Tax=Muricoccus nepalensis TaxID=1854500 RepID=A0A502GBN0_9PROT|nr:tannase/feruloyl esterase family alpha/beta hydrolase [Roseomonas nepalensis]TPG59677.1 tannase/feruloyl esterase family alpha/beta hydrolase [Roseomonas nepalensis]